VKLFRNLWVLPVAALVLLAAAPTARAQAVKPVAIVSIASIKENLADVNYLARIAGMEDAGKSAMFFGNALTAGINKEQPIGLFVVPAAGDFHGVAFVPVSDLKILLEVHKEQIGTPKDVGNGILEIGAQGRTAYIKEQAGWAFVAESKEHLAGLPQDPVSLLGDLPKKYNVAGKILVQNIPQELRRMAIDELKLGVERALNSPAAQGNVNPEDAKKAVQAQLAAVEQLIGDSEEVVIGLGVNAETKSTYLDFSFVAREGTKLARQMALQVDGKTSFAGFLLPEASVTFNVVQKVSPEDVQQIAPQIKVYREQVSKHLDDAPNLPAEKRDAAKAAIGGVFDLMEKTMSEGAIDMGGVLLLLPKSLSFGIGGRIADGAALEKTLKDVVGLLKDQPDFPQAQFNVGTIGDVKLHKLTGKIPDGEPEARELLGDKLEIVIGIGPKSVVVTGGKDAEGLLKKILERSAAEPNKAVMPLQINVAVLPILKFYKSVDDNPIVTGIISSLEKGGGDRISVTSQTGPRSSTGRFEIQEGIIKAIGEAAKAFGAGFDPNAL
jgi:hypothetical protein